MIVYVESNFVLELAYSQEEHQSCDEILKMAEAERIELVLPAFCISEPYDSLVRRANGRRSMLEGLQKEVGQLRRSEPYKNIGQESSATFALMARSVEEEKRRLDETMRRILRCAETIAVTVVVFEEALSLQQGIIADAQDAIVFASVADHLRTRQPEGSCFLNRNAGDFSDPLVVKTLQKHRCRLMPSFRDGVGYVQGQLR